ncbi:MAG: sigma 54-interacting transcriptional regulator [Methylotenera sp.]|uniref:sigma 54-interacting transcriptional regulator n=1 Tax=Methylotenera sp. TaxID=2051956 RepID=UPI002487F89F|nr:sigma 54-interacting transcriptional regulator [Methylotenera sp.]MDI1308581.1 sigma 54-interacting transcriptional regulator [Methylotenera sp.]
MQIPNILIVDDDKDILKLISIRLNAAGYNTVTANNGAEAMSAIILQRPDLVISDLRMPAMDGMALLDAIQQSHPSLPVIMLTAHGSIPDAVNATQRGVFSFLTKPFDSQALLQQVASALRLNGTHTQTISNEDHTWRADILTRSSTMESLLGQAKLVANTDASVFIQGESGSGKELLARAIHRYSARNAKPFVAINCGAIPENLLESELFGHNKGAFTGAINNHVGLFQSAEGGTLFLDEIGDMPQALQVKVLRALQERVIRPVGSTTNIPIDLRLISATHRNLVNEMKEGRFREDLFYRINVVSLEIPSLANRREDVSLLANHFLQVFSQKYKKKLHSFAPDALETLITAPWPGNVRQLQNIVEQTVVLATTQVIPVNLVQKALQEGSNSVVPLDVARQQFEFNYLINILKTTQGNVTQAARLAQRNRTEFYRLLDRHNIQASTFKNSSEDESTD